jgi:hypothetical protein
LKVIWAMWQVRDITTGDTTSYFTLARLWRLEGKVALSWSPLYTAFYGTMLRFSDDAFIATTAHRMVIVLVLPVLLLAVARRLLSPLMAWLVAAWWCVLPINFNALYEVHLFALIPILCVYLSLGWFKDSLGRGIALAGLLVAGALMRNELFVSWMVFAVVCLAYEVRRRRGGQAQRLRLLAVHYLAPAAIAVLLCLGVYLRAVDRGQLSAFLERKHTLNVCQVYAFGYQQRHPEWKLSPWTECQSLMQSTFGTPEPPFGEAFRRNPKAMMGHLLWNFSLAPAGVQVLLLNGMSGKVSPDYAPAISRPLRATAESALLAAVLAGGAIRLWRRRREVLAQTPPAVLWTWTAMACVASVSVVIIATQRPRPSYLFALGVLLMCLTARCGEGLIGPELTQRSQALLPAAAVAALLIVPCFYQPQAAQPRPLLAIYRTLRPFSEQLRGGAVAVVPGFSGEVCNLLPAKDPASCRAVDYYALRSRSPSKPLAELLAEVKADLFLTDENTWNDAAVRGFVAQSGNLGWETASEEPAGSGKRVLLRRVR